MTRSAAQVTPELHDLILALDDPLIPIAEICRLVGKRADELGIARPSYERIRVLIRRARERGPAPTATSVLVDIAMRSRPPEAFLDQISGVRPRRP
jgi:hypothetical protein